MLAMVPLDIHVSDTYFIVAHIHYVLFGGSLFTIFAGVYYWFPKMTGRMFDERLGKLHFWLTFIFFNPTFAPMHLIGVQGMPRRVADYPEQFAGWNLFISLALVRPRPLDADLRLQHRRVVARRPAGARRTRGARSRSSGRSPRRRRSSTSTACPTVVGGPYEYGVPGAVHGIFKPRRRGAARATSRAQPRLEPRRRLSRCRRSSSWPTRRSAAPSCSTRSSERAAGGRARSSSSCRRRARATAT